MPKIWDINLWFKEKFDTTSNVIYITNLSLCQCFLRPLEQTVIYYSVYQPLVSKFQLKTYFWATAWSKYYLFSEINWYLFHGSLCKIGVWKLIQVPEKSHEKEKEKLMTIKIKLDKKLLRNM